MADQMSLFGADPAAAAGVADPDAAAREFARDPANNVVLEASAGTGKTSVLVARYVNLLARGVDPANILAITFTRKAAAEMRERIIRELRRAAEQSAFDRGRWAAIRDRLADIQISTIDAFCLSLLREFPLEADLDPGFGMADETEVPRLVDQSLDRSLATFVARAKREPDIALVLAQLGLTRTREGLAYLLQRRLVAWDVLDRFLERGPADLDADAVCRRAVESLIDLFSTVSGGREKFLAEGPVRQPRYQLLAQDLRRLESFRQAGNASVRGLMDRAAAHFLKADGKLRTSDRIHPYTNDDYPSPEAGKRHRLEALRLGPPFENIRRAFSRDLNVVLSRGIRSMFAIALAHYRTALNDRSLLDFSDVLQRAVDLLGRMDEFSQSRYRLEGRYHHVLVDEFQDTSRKQWELISLLVKAWGEGAGLVAHPSIFIVGDRKQSIYRFRDAEVAVLQEAGALISALRPGSSGRRAISRSFRAVPGLLAFVNDLFAEVGRNARRPDDFKYDEEDRFPPPSPATDRDAGYGETSPPGSPARDRDAGYGETSPPGSPARDGDAGYGETSPPGSPARDRDAGYGETSPPGSPASSRVAASPVLGIVAGPDADVCAAAVAAEIERIIATETVRDKQSGLARAATPGDIAILFRSRASHREFEAALEARRIPTYVYKGLGFFDADEIKDLSALIRYLANPSSHLRAAAFLRSRFVRLSDTALALLAPDLAGAITAAGPPAAVPALPDDDRRALDVVRRYAPAWIAQVDRVPPADLIEGLIPLTAYPYELRGGRRQQAWENVKKMRGLIRRIQNRGYATLARIADHLDSLTAGDESNAVLEALDAVNLMTIHASKGLEFPIVFVVNLAKGATGFPRPVRVAGEDVSVGPFVSEMDEEERFRDREETKRLLYVALTRARDRLYLGSVLKDGAFACGRGSLGEVLPETLRSLFVRAAQEPRDVIEWSASSGTSYTFSICRPALPLQNAEAEAATGTVTTRIDLFGELADSAAVERVFAPARDPSTGTTRTACRILTQQEETAALLGSGDAVFDVPFSIVEPDSARVIRGTIDALIRHADGSIDVIALEQGPPAPQHERNLAVAVEAARRIFPGANVNGRTHYSIS